MKLFQKTPKCVLKFCSEAMKVLLVFFFISTTRLFLNVTSIINLGQFSILSAFSKNLKNGSIDYFKNFRVTFLNRDFVTQCFRGFERLLHWQI